MKLCRPASWITAQSRLIFLNIETAGKAVRIREARRGRQSSPEGASRPVASAADNWGPVSRRRRRDGPSVGEGRTASRGQRIVRAFPSWGAARRGKGALQAVAPGRTGEPGGEWRTGWKELHKEPPPATALGGVARRRGTGRDRAGIRRVRCAEWGRLQELLAGAASPAPPGEAALGRRGDRLLSRRLASRGRRAGGKGHQAEARLAARRCRSQSYQASRPSRLRAETGKTLMHSLSTRAWRLARSRSKST